MKKTRERRNEIHIAQYCIQPTGGEIPSIPIVYPIWMGPYAGHPSDGYQILKVLKTENKMES